MAEFTKIMEIGKRMCDSFKICKDCPLYGNPKQSSCYDLMMECPDEAEKIILQWDKEHPVKTRLTDFLEKHPKAELNPNGIPKSCAANLGYCEKCVGCGDCKACWSAPL